MQKFKKRKIYRLAADLKAFVGSRVNVIYLQTEVSLRRQQLPGLVSRESLDKSHQPNGQNPPQASCGKLHRYFANLFKQSTQSHLGYQSDNRND